jgi:hypothetical protein
MKLTLIPTTTLLEEGTRALADKGRAEESTKAGTLRGGTIGLAEQTDKGLEVSGTCHRQAMLRFMGIDLKGAEEESTRDLMFAAGRTNEDSWLEVLSAAWPGKILREEEVPVKWTTAKGTPVSGRPDIVLADLDGKLLRGLELKLVSSLWTARTVLQGSPKTNHLIQASHYMWKLGEQSGYEIPFELWYTSRVDWHVMGWAQKHFPKHGEANAEYCEYSLNKDGQHEIKKVLPFTKGFQLRFLPNGQLQFRDTGGKKWVDTIVSRARIQKYYEVIEESVQSKTLGPRPINIDYEGQKENWKQCDFCPLAKICDEYEGKDFEVWLTHVKERTNS